MLQTHLNDVVVTEVAALALHDSSVDQSRAAGGYVHALTTVNAL